MFNLKLFRIDWELRELGPRFEPVLARLRAAKRRPKTPRDQLRARRTPARHA